MDRGSPGGRFPKFSTLRAVRGASPPRLRGWTLCLLLLVAAFLPARGQDRSEIQGRWELPEADLGDPVRLKFEIGVPEERFFLLGIPTRGQPWGPATVTLFESRKVEGGGIVSVTLTVQIFETGKVLLPPLPVTVGTDGGETAHLVVPEGLTIRQLLPADAEPPHPAAPMAYPRGIPWSWLLGGAGLIILAAILACYLTFLLRRRIAAKPAPPRPGERDPDRWILDELERIFGGSMEPDKLYGILSQRVREYLRLKTRLPFPEWTTSEIRAHSRRISLSDEESLGHLFSSLDLCDHVKFARHRPSEDERDRTREDLRSFIRGLAEPDPGGGSA